ncbi:MAG: hypothetical protein F6J89_04725 [Symploca sp. SIO1C4]|uniref:Uncharacterized protein n=1 Tax=Symploca sp. SIO1C4 TaxID=2607765 RepID=A0A6B3N1H8_9CYAN|nr:hypothetical protein [Symploca sp. SIO1C4]NET04445.1 hypothetical protein [Symploca sp. SIO2B6]
MLAIRHRINPKTFVITLRQIAKHLKISPERILNWEKWHNVLWVHIQGIGGYFVSYRKLQQWLTACYTLMHGCRSINALDTLWNSILQETQRYTEEALTQLQALWQQRQAYLLVMNKTPKAN